MKLLYVDDKKTWHKLLEIVLSLRGIDVLHAYTPKEALNIAALEKPDLAVVDVSISNGSGYDVISDLVRLGVPVIFIGHTAEGFDRERALSLGAYSVLEKPFTVEELLDLLRQVKREAPKPEEHLELAVPQGGDFEVVNLEPETTEAHVPEQAEPEIPVLPVEEEIGEHVPVVPVEVEEEKEEEKVPAEPVVELEKPVEEELPHPEPVVGEAKEEVKRKAEEVSGITVPEEKVEEIIREIAWEVIPEIAERVIREEIEKLIRSRLA